MTSKLTVNLGRFACSHRCVFVKKFTVGAWKKQDANERVKQYKERMHDQ